MREVYHGALIHVARVRVEVQSTSFPRVLIGGEVECGDGSSLRWLAVTVEDRHVGRTTQAFAIDRGAREGD